MHCFSDTTLYILLKTLSAGSCELHNNAIKPVYFVRPLNVVLFGSPKWCTTVFCNFFPAHYCHQYRDSLFVLISNQNFLFIFLQFKLITTHSECAKRLYQLRWTNIFGKERSLSTKAGFFILSRKLPLIPQWLYIYESTYKTFLLNVCF